MILITPDIKGPALKAFQDSKGVQNALVAHDPVNNKNISLNNILQCFQVDPSGSERRVNSQGLSGASKALLSSGKHRISKEGIADQKALDIWWMLERGRDGVIAPLVKLAKKNDDCKKLLEAVQSKYDSGFAEIKEMGVSIDAYDALEALIIAHNGLDTKDAKKHLKSLAKEKSLKEELKARGVYMKIQQMLKSNKPKDQSAGQAGLGELAKRYPDTKYGKLAAGK